MCLYIVVIVVATFIFSSSLDSVLCSASVAIAISVCSYSHELFLNGYILVMYITLYSGVYINVNYCLEIAFLR